MLTDKTTHPLDDAVWRETIWNALRELTEAVDEINRRQMQQAQDIKTLRLQLNQVVQESTSTRNLNE